MPDSFPESPFADDPDIRGAALLTGNTRYPEWFRETDHPNYACRVASYAETTRRLNGLDTTPAAKPPTLARKAVSLAGAVATGIASGMARVTPEEQERRLAICRECVHFDRKSVACRRCGCKLSLKTRLEAWHCPLPVPKW